MKIAFIGLGNMGSGMASNLVKAAHEVHIYDINPQITEHLNDKDFVIHKNLDTAVKDVDAVVTMLPEGEHVREVYLSKNGVINNVKENTILIDCSTIDIETSLLLGKEAKTRGIKMIDAPVTGGVMGARIGKLNFLVGGDDDAVNKAKPLMDIMGQKILHAGPQGSGVGVKICNNMSLGISMIAASEALMLAKRLKMDLKKVHEIMKNASGNSWPISVYPPLPGLIDGTPSNNNYRAGFSAGMMNKDLKLANECAKQVNASTPLAKMALEIYDKFCEEGNDTKDFSAISKAIGGDAWNYPID